MRMKQATINHEQFYQDVLAALKKSDPDGANLFQYVAVMGQITGRLICGAFPNERDLARQTAIVNLDASVVQFGTGEATWMTKQ